MSAAVLQLAYRGDGKALPGCSSSDSPVCGAVFIEEVVELELLAAVAGTAAVHLVN